MPDSTIDSMPVPKWKSSKRIAGGSIAILLWVAVFAAGLLIDSLPYRVKLGWKPDAKANSEKNVSEIKQRVEALESEKKPLTQPAPDSSGHGDGKTQKKPEGPKAVKCSATEAFAIAAMTFMPSNIAILSIIAAFLGGCSVSEELIRDVNADAQHATGSRAFAFKKRLNYLTEHPAYSAFRGLVVFLLLISGLFVFAGAETLTSELEQIDGLGKYMRFAGIFSFIAYLAGHDPSVFTALLRLGSGRINGNGDEAHAESPPPKKTPNKSSEQTDTSRDPELPVTAAHS